MGNIGNCKESIAKAAQKNDGVKDLRLRIFAMFKGNKRWGDAVQNSRMSVGGGHF